MLNKKKNNKGFTLVELLVVIAIIGILAVVAVPALFKNIEKGKVAELESDISAIRSAALSYYADKGVYPNELVAKTSASNDTYASATVGIDLKKEIESLSNPFDANYIVGKINDNGTPANDKAVPPAALTLTIKTSKLSEDGFEKLKSDLGSMVKDGSSKTEITINIISATN